ncbi:MAG: Ribosomal small subunit methyltransferase [Chloroflexi bacterium]|nr:Ribosomal small subunit methyltransferase [Chloroflexota bacterium]
MGDARSQIGHHALQRFFVGPDSVTADHITLDAAQQHQIKRVLRLTEGMRVLVCDGSGDEILAELRNANSTVWAMPLERRQGRPEPLCNVRLHQSALRGDRFTWLLQKGTEIGISAFTPVLFERTQHADYSGRLERYRSVVQEAAEQCERCRLPIVEPVSQFSTITQAGGDQRGGQRLLLDERERSKSLRDVLKPGSSNVDIFVGPEGGLTEGERRDAIASGLTPVTLGSRVLRSETAGLVAATLVLGSQGDLG